MQVLVTGGTGFLGSHIAVALINAGHKVRLLVRSKNKLDRVFDAHNVTIDDFVIGDITDPVVVSKALDGCDAVIHTAAIVTTSKKLAEQIRHTNVGGTKLVVGEAVKRGIKHIHHISSITVIFDPNASKVDEASELGTGRSAYGKSKVECEIYIRSMQAEGEPIVVTYPTVVIGPEDPGIGEPMQGLKFYLSKLALITTTGIQYVDVRDIADVHVALLERPPGPDRFVLGGFYYTWQELVDELEHLTGRDLPKVKFPRFVYQVLGYLMDLIQQVADLDVPIDTEAIEYATQWAYADSSRLKQELNFEFRDKRQTLVDSIRWLGEHDYLTREQQGKLAR